MNPLDITFCVLTLIEPTGCVGDKVPPVLLTQEVCPLPGGRDYKKGVWFGDEICWKLTPKGDVELAGGAVMVMGEPPEVQCTKLRCRPKTKDIKVLK